ncbi:MAG: biopolymer transporter ExbD [Bacteroidetes bacterium]|nr:biopolymer transporter ExbD [Bacteroidota bacterium]
MNFSSRNKIKLEGGMASMTDLVFLLLIFFVIMSLMANNQTPVKSAGFKAEPAPNEEPIVKVLSNNEYEINGKKTSDYNQLREILIASVEKSGKKSVRIEYDKTNSEYQLVFNIISICQKNEWGFHFADPSTQKNVENLK